MLIMKYEIRIDSRALLEDFLRYVRMDTQSDPSSTDFPSTAGQLTLAGMLASELKGLGLEDAHVDPHGYVMATLPGNIQGTGPVMGLIAHMDTSPDMSGKDVRPLLHCDYRGGDIILDKEKEIVMRPADFPALQQHLGECLITTDGSTLLGADNKAGIAGIMSALRYFAKNPESPRGTLKIAFTPDEEIGKGTQHFNVEAFGADFAFTIDGGERGELQYENFNAAMARVQIRGRPAHPGDAKGKMINAGILGADFVQMLPVAERPEHTSGREGFYHLTEFRADVSLARMEFIIRDFDRAGFEQRKEEMRRIVHRMNEKYGQGCCSLEMHDQYYNMLHKVATQLHLIELAREAMLSLGIEPLIRPIRGGTDGARLSYMGLPCPNLFTGGHHFHSPYECISLESMILASQVIVRMASAVAGKASRTQ